MQERKENDGKTISGDLDVENRGKTLKELGKFELKEEEIEKPEIMSETSDMDREIAVKISGIDEDRQEEEISVLEKRDDEEGTNRAKLVEEEVEKIVESKRSGRVLEEKPASQSKNGEVGE